METTCPWIIPTPGDEPNTSLEPVCSRDRFPSSTLNGTATTSEPPQGLLMTKQTSTALLWSPRPDPDPKEQRHNLLPVGRKENDEGLRNSPAYTTPTESPMAQCSAIAMPACLPASADSRRCSLYLPAPVSTILFTEHHGPSHRRYHQDGSAAWTRSGNMLDIADRHSLQPPVLRSLPHGYQHLPTSPRDETQLSIVRTDRSTAPRPSDMPSPPPAAPIYDIHHTAHGTHGEPACHGASLQAERLPRCIVSQPGLASPAAAMHSPPRRPRPGIGPRKAADASGPALSGISCLRSIRLWKPSFSTGNLPPGTWLLHRRRARVLPVAIDPRAA